MRGGGGYNAIKIIYLSLINLTKNNLRIVTDEKKRNGQINLFLVEKK